jgi:hypothetical protein
MRQNADNEWYVVKTTRAASPSDVDAVKNKLETLRQRRRMHRMN